MTEQLSEIITRNEFDAYGIRVLDTDDLPAVGSYVEPSHVWTGEGERTEEMMDGASALSVGCDTVDLIVGRSAYYGGNVLVLLGSNGVDDGQDHGEIVMRNAKVLAVWTR